MNWQWRTFIFSVLALTSLTSPSMSSVAAEDTPAVPSASIQDQSPAVLRSHTRLVVVDVIDGMRRLVSAEQAMMPSATHSRCKRRPANEEE